MTGTTLRCFAGASTGVFWKEKKRPILFIEIQPYFFSVKLLTNDSNLSTHIEIDNDTKNG